MRYNKLINKFKLICIFILSIPIASYATVDLCPAPSKSKQYWEKENPYTIYSMPFALGLNKVYKKVRNLIKNKSKYYKDVKLLKLLPGSRIEINFSTFTHNLKNNEYYPVWHFNFYVDREIFFRFVLSCNKYNQLIIIKSRKYNTSHLFLHFGPR